MVLVVRHVQRKSIHVDREEVECRSFILEVHRGRGPQTVAIRHEGLLIKYARMRQSLADLRKLSSTRYISG